MGMDRKLPSMVKQITEAEDESRIYIEDYVYSYLNELKLCREFLPLRVALFGYTCKKAAGNLYFIYGAAHVTEELENGRDEEQVRNAYFQEYELIGYVNIYREATEMSPEKKRYCIFYDSNEPMQNYLLSLYHREENDSLSEEERKELAEVWQTTGKKFSFSVGSFVKKLLYLLGIILLAIAVTTIDDYQKIKGFVETAERAIIVSSSQY